MKIKQKRRTNGKCYKLDNIDFAFQRKNFNNIELSNIKSVQASLSKKEIVKEQAVIKAYESIKKLKKFGIKI